MNIKLCIIPMLNGIFPENLFASNAIDIKELKCPIFGIVPLRLLLESFKWLMLSHLISGPISPWNWFELRISSSSFLWSHIQFGISPYKLLADKSSSCNFVSPKRCSSNVPVKEEFLAGRYSALPNVWGTGQGSNTLSPNIETERFVNWPNASAGNLPEKLFFSREWFLCPRGHMPPCRNMG